MSHLNHSIKTPTILVVYRFIPRGHALANPFSNRTLGLLNQKVFGLNGEEAWSLTARTGLVLLSSARTSLGAKWDELGHWALMSWEEGANSHADYNDRGGSNNI